MDLNPLQPEDGATSDAMSDPDPHPVSRAGPRRVTRAAFRRESRTGPSCAGGPAPRHQGGCARATPRARCCS